LTPEVLFGRVIYEDIDLGKLVHSLLDNFSTKLFLANVAFDQETFAPVFFYQALVSLASFFFFEVND